MAIASYTSNHTGWTLEVYGNGYVDSFGLRLLDEQGEELADRLVSLSTDVYGYDWEDDDGNMLDEGVPWDADRWEEELGYEADDLMAGLGVEPQPVYPMVTVDGNPVHGDLTDEDIDVHVSLNEEGQANFGPLTWASSAAIRTRQADDSITVSVSTGDPRGAFTMTLRRLPDGRIVMHVPHADMSLAHRPLEALHPGTFVVK